MPKVETHLHLEGAMRASTVPQLSIDRMGWDGDYSPGWEHRYYTYTDFAGFMAQLTPKFPGTPEEYARLARECFEDLVARHVVYAEVSFDVPVRNPDNDGKFWPVIEALEAERRRAEARWPIRVNYIGALQRSQSPEVGMRRARLAVEAHRRGYGIVAIDLHGDEEHFGSDQFRDAFRYAAAHGLGVRAHAGEAAGAASVWEALEELGVSRIAHGTRAVEDAALLCRLQKRDVTLELCPTSNTRTGVVATLAKHPIADLYSMGIPVTVNSDDPLPFFTDIEREMRLLIDVFGLRPRDVWVMVRTALQSAFISEDERRTLLLVIDGAYEAALAMLDGESRRTGPVLLP